MSIPFDPQATLPDVADPAGIEIEDDLAPDPESPPGGGGGGDLYGGGGGPEGPAPRRRRATPFRGPLHWIDLTIPAPLVFWCQAWVLRHADLPVTDAATGRAYRLADAPLELQWDLYLRDVTARDVAADATRAPADQQYDWRTWFGTAVPPHLQPGPEAETAAGAQADALAALYIDTLRKVADGRLRPQDVGLIIGRMEAMAHGGT
jgi:hypothetical protein